jgi:hypothetical protein
MRSNEAFSRVKIDADKRKPMTAVVPTGGRDLAALGQTRGSFQIGDVCG